MPTRKCEDCKGTGRVVHFDGPGDCGTCEGLQYSRWRHVRRGTEYIIIGFGTLQASDNPLDGAEVVCYVDSRGPGGIWVRPLVEFLDGRFEPVEGT